MKMNAGEMFDRWTILRMKARFDDGAKNELARFEKETVTAVSSRDLFSVRFGPDGATQFLDSIAQLAEANAKIWLTEAAIRKEYSDDPAAKDDLSLEEVGRRALEIRGYNKLRIEAKKTIDELFGDTPDVKVDHASQ